LANDTYATARDQGLVTLDENVKLENVLYVHGLKCNLVSISKLCKQLNYAVTY